MTTPRPPSVPSAQTKAPPKRPPRKRTEGNRRQNDPDRGQTSTRDGGKLPAAEPLFDPFLFRALRKVGRGDIGTTTVTGALRQRNDDLQIRLFSALHMLRRKAYICLATTGPDPRDGWITAELTAFGTELLNSWNAQIQSSAAASPAR